jgi:hypothetical protein
LHFFVFLLAHFTPRYRLLYDKGMVRWFWYAFFTGPGTHVRLNFLKPAAKNSADRAKCNFV